MRLKARAGPRGPACSLRVQAALLVLLVTLTAACATSPPPRAESPPATAVPAFDPFLDTLQQRTFDWFWETTNDDNGLVPDRWPRPPFSSIAAIGFALTSYPVGVERGQVTRDQAAERVLTTLRFLWRAPQDSVATGVTGYRGFFYHFLDMETGHRYQETELSTIDTALLMAGVLAAQEYFDANDPEEASIRAYADSLYLRIEWDWVRPDPPLIGMAWRPGRGLGPHSYQGYDEAMILYVLALGSPTHPIEPAAWDAFTSTYVWGAFYGQEHVNFAPLFGHQYSHVWIDFRGIRDEYMREKGIDYFENSRRATVSQRAYVIDNPGRWKDYGPTIWGLTACDGPTPDTLLVIDGVPRRFHAYWARGAALNDIRDDGTIAPTAAGGSIPFAPQITVAALKAMRDRYGEHLYTHYGFLDAFNPTFDVQGVPLDHGAVVPGVGWFDDQYLGIDQGPILLMIENHRNGFVWELMKENPYIVRGLCRAGFRGGWLEEKCERAA
jgi:hypothetical protein